MGHVFDFANQIKTIFEAPSKFTTSEYGQGNSRIVVMYRYQTTTSCLVHCNGHIIRVVQRYELTGKDLIVHTTAF